MAQLTGSEQRKSESSRDIARKALITALVSGAVAAGYATITRGGDAHPVNAPEDVQAIVQAYSEAVDLSNRVAEDGLTALRWSNGVRQQSARPSATFDPQGYAAAQQKLAALQAPSFSRALCPNLGPSLSGDAESLRNDIMSLLQAMSLLSTHARLAHEDSTVDVRELPKRADEVEHWRTRVRQRYDAFVTDVELAVRANRVGAFTPEVCRSST